MTCSPTGSLSARPVALSDVGKALKQSNMRQGPALMFKQNGTEFPLVGGVYSTRGKALLAFEATNDNIFDKVVAGLSRRVPPSVVSGQAPCQEHVITGETRLRGWACKTRTQKCCCKISL
jgi:4-hydroxy-3-polyprenylbenzoate decarboxylase/2,5-furandicarboxylate decarboxylase 1